MLHLPINMKYSLSCHLIQGCSSKCPVKIKCVMTPLSNICVQYKRIVPPRKAHHTRLSSLTLRQVTTLFLEVLKLHWKTFPSSWTFYRMKNTKNKQMLLPPRLPDWNWVLQNPYKTNCTTVCFHHDRALKELKLCKVPSMPEHITHKKVKKKITVSATKSVEPEGNKMI